MERTIERAERESFSQTPLRSQQMQGRHICPGYYLLSAFLNISMPLRANT